MIKFFKAESQQKKEARLILGMFTNDSKIQNEFFKYLADYFYEKHTRLFQASPDILDEIFQNTLIKVWNDIQVRNIRVENNIILGKDNQVFKGSIRTYFMSVSKYKYLEWAHENPYKVDYETEMAKKIRAEGFDEEEYSKFMFGNSKEIQLQIIDDLLPKMSTCCQKILTKYYYEEKTLDEILKEITSISTKNTLKTKKSKCIKNLQVTANYIYEKYLNL